MKIFNLILFILFSLSVSAQKKTAKVYLDKTDTLNSLNVISLDSSVYLREKLKKHDENFDIVFERLERLEDQQTDEKTRLLKQKERKLINHVKTLQEDSIKMNDKIDRYRDTLSNFRKVIDDKDSVKKNIEDSLRELTDSFQAIENELDTLTTWLVINQLKHGGSSSLNSANTLLGYLPKDMKIFKELESYIEACNKVSNLKEKFDKMEDYYAVKRHAQDLLSEVAKYDQLFREVGTIQTYLYTFCKLESDLVALAAAIKNESATDDYRKVMLDNFRDNELYFFPTLSKEVDELIDDPNYVLKLKCQFK